MQLYQFEGKQLLSHYSLPIPPSTLFPNKPSFSGPYVVKLQTLTTNRLQQGGILFASTLSQALSLASQLYNRYQQPVLIEQQLTIRQEYFLALRFSTQTRSPQLLFSRAGGAGIEQRASSLRSFSLDYNNPRFPDLPVPSSLLTKLYHCFIQEDITHLELNPLILDDRHQWFILDAKIALDDEASFRHHWSYPPRTLFNRPPTAREVAAHQVNAQDHRGTAGATYLDLGGDIGVLASGGGASIIIMDTLLAHHLQPANYTEYSGNPPRQKVKALADIVLSHPLRGLLVVGGNANFTDIYETLMGVMDAILDLQPLPHYPIVIRRGGPRWQEAFQALRQIGRQHHLNLHLFGPHVPMTYAVTHLVHLLQKTKNHD